MNLESTPLTLDSRSGSALHNRKITSRSDDMLAPKLANTDANCVVKEALAKLAASKDLKGIQELKLQCERMIHESKKATEGEDDEEESLSPLAAVPSKYYEKKQRNKPITISPGSGATCCSEAVYFDEKTFAQREEETENDEAEEEMIDNAIRCCDHANPKKLSLKNEDLEKEEGTIVTAASTHADGIPSVIYVFHGRHRPSTETRKNPTMMSRLRRSLSKRRLKKEKSGRIKVRLDENDEEAYRRTLVSL